MILFPHLFYRLLWSPARKQVHFAQLLLARRLSVLLYIYRTHVHMGSDHWVALSVRHSETFVDLEALVKDPS